MYIAHESYHIHPADQRHQQKRPVDSKRKGKYSKQRVSIEPATSSIKKAYSSPSQLSLNLDAPAHFFPLSPFSFSLSFSPSSKTTS